MNSRLAKRLPFTARSTLLCVLAVPTVVTAHAIKGVGDFYAGVLHPLASLEFLLPWIALALRAGQQGRKVSLLTLGLFPLALTAGAFATLSLLPSAWITGINFAVIPILGLTVALVPRCPIALTILMATLVGFLQGMANGTEITTAMSPSRFIADLGVSAILILSYGIGLARSLQKPWTQIALRVGGSWIAAIGIMVCELKF